MIEIAQSFVIVVLAMFVWDTRAESKAAYSRIADLKQSMKAHRDDVSACYKEAALTNDAVNRLKSFPRELGYEWRPDASVPGHWAKKKGGKGR